MDVNSQKLNKIITGNKPIKTGKSKKVYKIDKEFCLVELIPSLSSFTFSKHKLIPRTDVIRLDFYEIISARLQKYDIPVAFCKRVDQNKFISKYCTDPPFEIIVKNFAVGSTTRKYPGLFPENHRFKQSIVKFDFRIDPEDYPIPEDYIREYGLNPMRLREIALNLNYALKKILSPLTIVDFCIIIGLSKKGEYTIISEISPDCMRIRDGKGNSYDKDLFRIGYSDKEIIEKWEQLLDMIK